MKELFPLNAEQFRTLNIAEDLHDTSIYQTGFEHFHIHRLEEVKAHLITSGAIHRKAIPDLIVLTKGTIERNIHLKSYQLVAPALCAAPAYSIISNQSLSNDAEGFYCHFSPTYIADALKTPNPFGAFHFLKSNSNPVHAINKDHLAVYQSMLEQLLRDYRSNDTNKQYILFHQLLTLLFRLQSKWPVSEKSEKVSVRFEELLATHFPKWTTVNEYADALHISPNHLNKIVKAETGKPVSSFIKEMTLLHAKVLLKENKMTPVATISESLKFSESAHFSRFFKKHTGKTPSQYRDE